MFKCQICRTPVMPMRLETGRMVYLSRERTGGPYCSEHYFYGIFLGWKRGVPRAEFTRHRCLLDWPLYRLFRLKVFCARLRSKWNL